MRKFWCHEYETGSLYLGPLLKRSLSFTLRTILRSPETIWPHGAYRNCESEQLQGGRSWVRPWKSSCCKLALLLKIFEATELAIGNAWRLLILKVRRDFILDGLLIQNVANIQSVKAFIGEFDIQKRAVLCFCRFTDPDSFEKPVRRNIQNDTSKSMSGRSKLDRNWFATASASFSDFREKESNHK